VHLVGSLRDSAQAQEIISQAAAAGINIKLEKARTHTADGTSGEEILNLWVESEDQVNPARELFAKILGLIPKNKQEIPLEWKKIWKLKYRPITLGLLGLSVGVSLLTKLGTDEALRAPLLIESGHQDIPLTEIYNGQWWRLVTPVFLHFGPIHLFFNMMWLKDLGRIVEDKFKSLPLVLLILFTSIFSNLLQYAFTGPGFGGMSGVVYALLSINYRLKQQGITDLAPGKSDLILMVIWFLVCLTGWFGPVANMAHAGGIFVGMLWPLHRLQLRESAVNQLSMKKQLFATMIAAGTMVLAGGAEYLKLSGKLFLISE
jgi:GlpG protein